MHEHRFLSSLILTAALLVPVSSQAGIRPQERREGTTPTRVYDRSHKDYHVWDDHEDQTYRQYLGDQHQTYRPIAKLNKKQQTVYWNFRHTSGEK